MTKGRLDNYMALYLWEGGLAAVGWQNFLDARWGFLAVNCVLLVCLVACHVWMRRRDRARGQLVNRRSDDAPPACDCHEDEGAVHLTLVMNPKRRSGTVTIGHTRFGADCAIEYLRAGDDLAAWQPQWLSEQQEDLLRQLVFDLYEECEP